MERSFAQRIREASERFVLYHTYDASRQNVERAIDECKSIDLDVSVDEMGRPYLGHSLEFYEKSGEARPRNMTFWEAIDLVAGSNIPAVVDCKDDRAWQFVEQAVEKLGPHRCLVHAYAAELKFDYYLYDLDYESEWLGIARLRSLKERYPSVTTTASAKFLPSDLLVDDKHRKLLLGIRETLSNSFVDTVCLNVVPEGTMSDGVLALFLEKGIVPHVNVDSQDVSRLALPYVGESDILARASDCCVLGY